MPIFKFTNEEYRNALCYRYLITNPLYKPELKCICKEKITLDPYCHHLVSGCKSHGCRIERHNLVVQEVEYICQYADRHTKREEQDCFITDVNIADPPGRSKETRH